MKDYIDRLQRALDSLTTEAEDILASAEAEERDLSEKEEKRFDEILKEKRAKSEKIASLQEDEAREAEAAEKRSKFDNAVRPGGQARVNKEARTYERGNGNTYFADRVKAEVRHDAEAVERLNRHAEEERALSQTDGSGGYFTPPGYVVEDFVDFARAGRVTANLVESVPMPKGTNTVRWPKIVTGSSVGSQASQNTAVAEVDITDSEIQVDFKTIAGAQTFSLQLLDQSPFAFDQVVIRDLSKAYAQELDRQVIEGNGTGGELKGILNTAGINVVDYDDSTPTVAELWPKFNDAIQRVTTARFMQPECIVMHPRRWAWLNSALDSTNRPLFLPAANGAYNAMGINRTETGGVAEGLVGVSVQGLPVFVDANIPTDYTDAAATPSNVHDPIIIMRGSDHVLFETPLQVKVDPYSGLKNLSVSVVVYSYAGFTAERFVKSTSVITGTGLTAPSF